MHIALTNIAAERLAEAEVSHDKIIGFLAQNLSTYHLMLRQERLVDGQIDKAVLLRVTAREITAGRMKHDDPLRAFAERSEESRVGKECVRTCKTRRSQYHKKKKKQKKKR